MRRALQGAACSWQELLPNEVSGQDFALRASRFMLSGIATLAITLSPA